MLAVRCRTQQGGFVCKIGGCDSGDIKARGMCMTCYNRWWYENNKEKHMEDVARNGERYRSEAKRVVEEFKAEGCVRCGYDNPVAIDCHHVDGSDKGDSIGRLVSNRQLEAVRRELEKCVPVCANCHRLVHWGEAELGSAPVS